MGRRRVGLRPWSSPGPCHVLVLAENRPYFAPEAPFPSSKSPSWDMDEPSSRRQVRRPKLRPLPAVPESLKGVGNRQLVRLLGRLSGRPVEAISVVLVLQRPQPAQGVGARRPSADLEDRPTEGGPI